MAYGGNGPRAGRTTGRARNTNVNNASKAPSAEPPVGPESASSYAGQRAALQTSFFDQLSLIKQQGGMLKGAFIQGKADIRDSLRGGVAAAEEDALGRGIVGSSSDSAARAGVFADAARARVENRNVFTEGRLGLKSARIGAKNEYLNGLFQVQAAERAEQMQLAAMELQADLAYQTNQASIESAHIIAQATEAAAHDTAMAAAAQASNMAAYLNAFRKNLIAQGRSPAQAAEAVNKLQSNPNAAYAAMQNIRNSGAHGAGSGNGS